MLQSFEQARSSLDAIRALGILTPESLFRLIALGIYLTQNAFYVLVGHGRFVWVILCYYSNAFFLFFYTFFLFLKPFDSSWLPSLIGKQDKSEKSSNQQVKCRGLTDPFICAYSIVRVITGIKGATCGVKWH